MRLILVTVLVVAAPTSARADNLFPEETIVSPGIKLGYTFGARGSWTFGLEVTVLRSTGDDASLVLAHGPALNLSWSRRGTTYLRLGWEAVSWGVGVEGGPAVVRTDDGVRLGLAVSPWIGAFVVPYYAYTFVPGDAAIRELGTYLKLPLCTGCEGGDGGGDWWDDDD